MTKDPFLTFLKLLKEFGDELEELCFMKLATNVGDKLEKLRADFVSVNLLLENSEDPLHEIHINLHLENIFSNINLNISCLASLFTEMCSQKLSSLISKEGEHLCVGGRRVVDAIVVSAVILLSFVYLYLTGFIDRGSSTTGSSGSLDFRDIYISIILFQAAYVWIKFRDVIPGGAVYYRPKSKKFEPRIKFPVMKGVGGTSKRIPLGLYNTFGEGEVAYQIAAFYCKKPKHTGWLNLGGGASFSIPALSMDPNLPYEEKVKQVGVQVLKVYAEFEEQKASQNLLPSIAGRESSPIQQLHNSGMFSVIQGEGSALDSNTHNGVDLNNQGCLLLLHAQTQHELLDAYKQIECLKSQVSQTEFKNMEWEVKFSDLDMKYSELERKFSELEQKSSELECENQLLNHQIKQSQLPILQEFDVNRFLCMRNKESLAR